MKRGISPVIATILLIIMTVGIAALMYTWMSGMLSQLTTQTGQQILQTTAFDFSVAPVGINGSNFVVSIRNTGSVNIDFSRTPAIAAVTAYDRLNPEAGVVQQATCSNISTGTLGVGQSGVFTFTCSGITVNISKYYYVLRVTIGSTAKEVTFT